MVHLATEAFQIVGFVFKIERFPGGYPLSLEEKLRSSAKRVSVHYAVILIFGLLCDLCQEKNKTIVSDFHVRLEAGCCSSHPAFCQSPKKWH